MPRHTWALEEDNIALMWRAWANDLLEAAEQGSRRKAAAFLARKVDIFMIADRARRDIIRGLMSSLFAEEADWPSQTWEHILPFRISPDACSFRNLPY